MILPLNEEKLYLMEMTDDGKKLKESGIVPILKENSNLEEGVVYIKSLFQDNEYFDVTNFDISSFENWKNILFKLVSKLGATKIKTTLAVEYKSVENINSKNNLDLKVDGKKKLISGQVTSEYEKEKNELNTKEIKHILEDEKETNGVKSSLENLETWILTEKINLKAHPLLLELYEDFKDGRTIKRTSTIEIKSIITGINDVNNVLKVMADVSMPLFKAGVTAKLSNLETRKFEKYENKNLMIEIIC